MIEVVTKNHRLVWGEGRESGSILTLKNGRVSVMYLIVDKMIFLLSAKFMVG